MSVLDDFLNDLNTIEDGELKSKLTSSFGQVKGAFNDVILTRDKLRSQKTELKEFKDSIKDLMGLDSDDFSVSDLKDKLGDSNNDVQEALKKQAQSFELDSEKLRTELNDYKTKFEDLEFNSMIEREGLLKGFTTDNPRVKDMLLNEFKKSLIKEDGKFYVKDEITGDKRIDRKSGDFMSPKDIKSSMLESDEWSPFVERQTQGTGTQAPVQQQSGGVAKKFTDYTSSELVELRKTNPAQYDLLKQQG